MKMIAMLLWGKKTSFLLKELTKDPKKKKSIIRLVPKQTTTG